MALSNMFTGMISGAGSGMAMSGGNPWAALGGAAIGGIFGALEKDAPEQQMSPWQAALAKSDTDLINGVTESPEVLAMRAQGNKNTAQAAGLMQQNRGSSQGARGAYIAGLTAEKGAQLNEAAVAANAKAINEAKIRMGMMVEQQSKMNYANALAKTNQYNAVLGSSANLLMQGALAYSNRPISKKDGADMVGSANDANTYLSNFNNANPIAPAPMQNTLGEQSSMGYDQNGGQGNMFSGGGKVANNQGIMPTYPDTFGNEKRDNSSVNPNGRSLSAYLMKMYPQAQY